MNNFIEIINDGFLVKSTNYWDTEQASRGFFYLSWNSGNARLLIPDSMQPMVKEIMTAQYVVISRVQLENYPGREFYELFFEDHSSTPYVIHLAIDQSDRIIPQSDEGRDFYFHAFTRAGLQVAMKAKFEYKLTEDRNAN